MSQIDRAREHLIEVYRRKAKHYDLTSRISPVPGYPEQDPQLQRAIGFLQQKIAQVPQQQ